MEKGQDHGGTPKRAPSRRFYVDTDLSHYDGSEQVVPSFNVY